MTCCTATAGPGVGTEMTQALIEMMKKNSPPMLEGVPIGLMRLFMEREIADYLGSGISPIGIAAGGSMTAIVANMAKLTPEDRASMAELLARCGGRTLIATSRPSRESCAR